MAVTNEFLTERYINRGMRDADGNIYVYNNGEYFMASTDAEAMAALDGGGVAISSSAYTNESYGGTSGSENAADTAATRTEAENIAAATYSYLPQGVRDEFIKQYIETGDAGIALGLTRKSQVWMDNFSHLLNEDGTLAMTEQTSLEIINTYKQTLSEVGITDFTEFEDDFKEMVTSVSGLEFQDRIDIVYEGVINQIPEVQELFARELGIEADAPTILAALINPKIEDKFLKGQIKTVQLGAKAKSQGFNFTFDKFDTLRKQGLTLQQADALYKTAGGIIDQAKSIGRELDISTLESATLGQQNARDTLARIQAELASTQGINIGAVQKDGNIVGLLEN
tara:strand:- start:351 stop:1370 length:1020 start_codon:yes stop_codon:yes gene_type:complete